MIISGYPSNVGQKSRKNVDCHFERNWRCFFWIQCIIGLAAFSRLADIFWQRSEKTLESAVCGFKSFCAPLEMTTYSV